MFTAFRRFLGFSTRATKGDVYDLIAALQKSATAAEVNSHPHLVADVQTFSGRREATFTCRKTHRRVARVRLVPGKKPDISWGVLWS